MEEKIAYQSYERARDIQVCVGRKHKVCPGYEIKIAPFRMSQLFRTLFFFLLSHPALQLVISDMKPVLQMTSGGGDKKKISLKY